MVARLAIRLTLVPQPLYNAPWFLLLTIKPTCTPRVTTWTMASTHPIPITASRVFTLSTVLEVKQTVLPRFDSLVACAYRGFSRSLIDVQPPRCRDCPSSVSTAQNDLSSGTMITVYIATCSLCTEMSTRSSVTTFAAIAPHRYLSTCNFSMIT